ncbi:T9SS sorting signal type C domain-containing protein [Flavobacterium sp. RHBU_24]|uniref:T9SS sorting signal type C domain-containing protein n=1 Tax=Flavobacterium sp. RHBU_24 TaxID=3391185 RepID=UPI0039852AF8
MRVRKITSLQRLLYLCLFLAQAVAYSQTVTGIAPGNVTQRSIVTISGSGFTSSSTVRFYTTADSSTSATYVSAASVSFISETQLRVIVPTVIAAGAAQATRSIRVYNGSTPGAAFTYTYTPPALTPASAGITKVITNHNGYWNSAASGGVQPDSGHSVMAFQYGGTLYSTGSEAAITSVLASSANTGTYTTGNWRALPINNIAGTVPDTNSGNPTLIVLASTIDGNANSSVPGSPAVAGLSVRDVLIDGIRGLNLGTGVTNLPATSVLTFQAQNILQNVAGDAKPDILVSQVADPSDNSFSVYCFTDASGNIVGNPMQIALNSVTSLGNYKTDFFTLPAGAALNTATVNGWTTIGTNTRPIRMVGYKLSDFGIDEQNKGLVTQFKVMPSGTGDPAFMAYNRESFNIPAPEITGQPQSIALCPGSTANFTVTLAATGTETVFQWEKNGVALTNGATPGGSVISGATSATLTITGIVPADNGIYRCVVSNSAGAAFSNDAYLNTVTLDASPATGTCITAPATIFVSAEGNNPQYQWYSNTTNSNTGGTSINGATGSTYAPPVATAGTTYYYAESYPAGYSCAVTKSAVIPFTVYSPSVAGTVNDNQTVCPGTGAVVFLTGHNGAVQWQSTQVSDGSGGWTDIAGANAASYSIPSVNGITYYRAVVTNGTCGAVTSGTTSVTANTTFIWTGNESTNWNTASNWSCDALPTPETDVTIPAAPINKPVVNNDGLAHAKSLIVNDGAHITIATGGSLQVVNNISVAQAGIFVVENNGALIQDNETSNSGIITVKRDTNPLYRLDYTLWSSPVSDVRLRDFSMATSNNRFYEYKYDFNGLANVEGYWPVDPLTTYFTPAKAILIRMPNVNPAVTGYSEGLAATVFNGVFTGNPYNGTIQIPLSVMGNRYTAIGNPYASPINIKNFFTQNSGVLKAGTPIYLWRKRNNQLVSSYATVTLSAFVANQATWDITGLDTPGYTSGGQTQAGYFSGNSDNWLLSQGQGFIVKTNDTDTTSPMVTFTNAMRKPVPQTGGQAFFRTAAETQSRLWLNFKDTENAFSQLAVAYSEGQTLGIDYGYDGLSLSGEGNMSIYTLAGENNLTIQSRPEFDVTDVVPVGYTTTHAGSFTIGLDHVDGVFEAGQKIYLRDNAEGIVRDLTQGSYTFTSETGTVNNRFDIIYASPSAGLGTDSTLPDPNTVVVYRQNNVISINSGNTLMNSVKVYDIRGRVLYSQDNINAAETSINNLSVQQQVIVVEVNTEKGTVSKKVIF